MKKKRTKDQQIKHLKATIGGLVRSLRYADDAICWSRDQRLLAEEKLKRLVDRLGGPAALLKQEGEEMRAMAYRNGVPLAPWERLQ